MSVYFSFSLTVLVISQAESGGLALNLSLYLIHLQIPCNNMKMKPENIVGLWQSGHGSRCQGLMFCDLVPSFCVNRCQWRSWDGAVAHDILCRWNYAKFFPAKSTLPTAWLLCSQQPRQHVEKKRKGHPSHSVCLDVRTWWSVYVGDAD